MDNNDPLPPPSNNQTKHRTPISPTNQPPSTHPQLTNRIRRPRKPCFPNPPRPTRVIVPTSGERQCHTQRRGGFVTPGAECPRQRQELSKGGEEAALLRVVDSANRPRVIISPHHLPAYLTNEYKHAKGWCPSVPEWTRDKNRRMGDWECNFQGWKACSQH